MVRHLGLMLAVSLLAVPMAAPVATAAPGRPGAAAITGHAWKADNTPLPAARLRLRNVASGRIAAVTIADDGGQFRFADVEPGSYLVELVNETGHVLTVGHVFTIAQGEAVATFVRLSARVPWFTGFFGNAAAAVASSAASQGITALAPIARPASAGR